MRMQRNSMSARTGALLLDAIAVGDTPVSSRARLDRPAAIAGLPDRVLP